MAEYEKNRITLISLSPRYSEEVFAETRGFIFLREPFFRVNKNKKIYVAASNVNDTQITGTFVVSDVINGSLYRVMTESGFDQREDANEIVEFFNGQKSMCYTIKLKDVTEFERPLDVSLIRDLYPNFKIDRQFKYVEGPVRSIIEDWDRSFALDGTPLPKDSDKEVAKILEKARQGKYNSY